LAGNRLIALYSIPLPGAVVGLVLLAGALAIARRVSAPGTAWLPENVAPASRALLNHLGLLFVPAGCAVLTEGDVLRRNWIPILAALVVSTTLGLAVCGWIMHRFVSGRAE
jgi:holin-like protein